jgi:cytosine/adenosine deaminase-related metal-dependent hydrolase
MEYVSGEIFTVNGFKRGYLGVENHRIMDRGKDSPPKKPMHKGLIVPTFVNAHTHIGDSFIRKRNLKLPRNVEDLVAPPDGLKHRLLKETSDQEIVDGMRESIDEMTKTGISHFCDFRENGLQGINHLKKALVNSNISPIILSRPNQLTYNRDEVDLLLKNSQGIGLSSITDWKYSEIEKIAKHIKKRKKTFAIHASERIRENIDQILDLKPDFLIHMNCATESDLICVKDSNVPVVVCPRSNAFFGLKPNIELMNEIGIDIMLGTDNAMLNAPNILDELNYVKNMTEVFSIEHLLNMITYNPRKALNLDYSILDFNSLDEFIVLDKKNLGVLYISGNQREI